MLPCHAEGDGAVRPVWRCKCEYEEDDKPFTKRPLAAHLLNGGRVDGPGLHALVGLYDGDTGELVMDTTSRREALRRGVVSDGTPQNGADQQVQRPQPKQPKQASYIRGQTLYRNVPLSTAIEGYFALYRATFNDDWTSDDAGLARFLEEIVEAFTREHLHQIFGFEYGDALATAQVEKVLEKIKRMANPDAEEDDPRDATIRTLQQRIEALERRLSA